jgi:lipopolysaccharide assembly protein A
MLCGHALVCERFYTIVHLDEPLSPVPLAMIRPLRILIALVCLATGIALGALNPAPVSIDLGVLRFEAALGVALLGVLLLGVVIGGLALTVSVVLPMRHRHRRERMAAQAGAHNPQQATTDALITHSTERSTEPGGIVHGLHQ